MSKMTHKLLYVLITFCLILGTAASPMYADEPETPADDPIIEEYVNVTDII